MSETGRDFFDKRGPLPLSLEEVRQFPRFYFRLETEAVIYPLFPAEKPRHSTVLTCDLSRSGLKIKHHTQLFPGQQIDLMLGDQPRRVEVVWCRRQKYRDYEIGC